MGDREGVLADLQDAAREVLGDEAPELALDARLGEGGVTVESLDLIEIVMELEERYDIELDAAALRELTTVGELVDVILARR